MSSKIEANKIWSRCISSRYKGLPVRALTLCLSLGAVTSLSMPSQAYATVIQRTRGAKAGTGPAAKGCKGKCLGRQNKVAKKPVKKNTAVNKNNKVTVKKYLPKSKNLLHEQKPDAWLKAKNVNEPAQQPKVKNLRTTCKRIITHDNKPTRKTRKESVFKESQKHGLPERDLESIYKWAKEQKEKIDDYIKQSGEKSLDARSSETSRFPNSNYSSETSSLPTNNYSKPNSLSTNNYSEPKSLSTIEQHNSEVIAGLTNEESDDMPYCDPDSWSCQYQETKNLLRSIKDSEMSSIPNVHGDFLISEGCEYLEELFKSKELSSTRSPRSVDKMTQSKLSSMGFVLQTNDGSEFGLKEFESIISWFETEDDAKKEKRTQI